MSVITLEQVEQAHGLTHLEHLDRQAQVPVVRRRGAQGDVLVRRTDAPAPATRIPAEGLPVVRGENGGNTHLLVGAGTAEPVDDGSLTIARVGVPDEGTVLLSHPEHGALILGPGCWEVRRQREQADEIRMVQD